MSSGPRFPQVAVQLTGQDGNVFNLIGRCNRAAKGKITQAELDEFMAEVMDSHSYDAALAVMQRWFTVR